MPVFQYGMYVHGHKESAAENLSGAKYSMFRCQSGLINGRGRYRDPVTGQSNGAPLETFSVRLETRVITSVSLLLDTVLLAFGIAISMWSFR